MVYAMQFADKPGVVKFGCSGNVERRADQLSAMFGDVTILKTLPGMFEEEQKIKSRFAGQRIPGTEFFRVTRELRSWLNNGLL
jgi:hypothetical protein